MTINEVIAKHSKVIMALPGVTGIGAGREGESDVIVVLVEKRNRKLLRRIPSELEGFTVIVRETGALRAL